MKHLRKDDGYVLVYVLIVFTILSIVAISICNAALFNLKAQKADVARMEARYAAEGELQKLVAEIEAMSVTQGGSEGDAVTAETKTAFWGTVIYPENISFFAEDGEEPKTAETAGDEEAVQIIVTRKNATNRYEATITAKVTIQAEGQEATAEAPAVYATAAVTYESYDISYKEVPQ